MTAMKQAMWKVLPATSPGLTQSEVYEAVVPHLPEDLYPGGREGWLVGEGGAVGFGGQGALVREPTKPLRWRRAS